MKSITIFHWYDKKVYIEVAVNPWKNNNKIYENEIFQFNNNFHKFYELNGIFIKTIIK